MKAGKKLIRFTLLMFLHLSGIIYSQNECSKWIFGQGVGLDFMTSPPTVSTYSSLTGNGSPFASVADTAGNLLFYADPWNIYNKAHQVMANGAGLMGGESMIVKKPGSSSQYYVFTTGGSILYYSIVDLSLAAGMGSVTVLNTSLISGIAHKLTGTLHCNGRDFWIVTHEDNSNNFCSFLLSPAGINTTPVISSVGSAYVSIPPSNFFGIGGYLKISPNGKKLGTSLYTAAPTFSDSAFELFDFDNSTGTVSNPQSLIKQITGPYGCEFSPDGTKFYGSVFSANALSIYQWDLCSPTGTANLPSLYTYTTNFPTSSYNILNMQLAPDGRIYIGRSTYINSASMPIPVINNPNSASSAFNFQFNGQAIAPNQSSNIYLPNFMNSCLLPRPVSAPFTYTVNNGFCNKVSFTAPPPIHTMSVTACSVNGFSLASQIWDFGDPASGASNTSTLNNPTHFFSSQGTFTVQLIRYYTCTGGTDTLKQVININQPCLSVSSTSITCASLGSATVTPLTGTGPYSFTWIPGNQTNSVATGLSPGTYTIHVFDPGNNYTYSTTTSFISFIPLTGMVSNSGSLSCYGTSNGTAQVTNLAGGSGTENYIWTNGVNTYTVPAPQNLTSGTWSVTVTDVLTACQIHSVFSITEPPALTVSLTAGSPSVCQGGTIVLTGTATGGIPGYSYNWTGGPTASSFAVTENSAGTFVYTLNAVDANTCTASNTIAVDYVPNPVISIPTVSICAQETAALVASGANSYTWTGNVNGSTFTVSPPVTGNHSYVVTGFAQGCVSTATGIVHVKSPPLVLLSSNSPVCEGRQLSLFGTNGAANQWTGPMAFTSTLSFPVINNVLPTHSGVYNVTVTGVNGCTATASTPVLTVHPTPTLSAAGATLCSSQTLVLNGSSVPGASFLWKGPLSFSSTAQNPVIVHPPVSASGDYTLQVTSAESCTNSAVAHVSVVPPPSLTVALSAPSLCAQAFNGSPNTITLTSSGADTYTLYTASPVVINDPNSPSASLSTDVPYLPAGLSTATLVGSNGICEISHTATFSVIANPTISIGSSTPVICAGENYTYTSHGAQSYVWTSSTPNFTTWSNGGTAVAHSSIQSVFSVYGSSLGCHSALKTSTITVNPIPTLSVTASQNAVCRFSQATLEAKGSVTKLDWHPQQFIDNFNGNSATVTVAADQVYTVTGSALGCTTSAVAFIKALDLPKPLISQSKNTYCPGEKVSLTGNGGLFYHWSGPHNFHGNGQLLSFSLEHAGMAGIYTLTVTDKNGCRASALEEVALIPFPPVHITGSKTGCAPWCGEFELSGNNLSSSWQSQAQSMEQHNNRFKLCFSKGGEYIVTGTITDENSKCKSTQSFVVNVYEKPEADFSWLPEKPVAGMDEVLLLNNSTGNDQTQWRWYMQQDPAFRAETENASYVFQKEGKYPIVYFVQNAWNCSDTVIKILDIGSDFVFYMPNAFTPNADSKNELFKPAVSGIRRYHMEVFNRWGELLFVTEDPETGWDGTYGSLPCKQDSYVWRVVLTTNAGEQKTYTGSVMLVR